MIVAGCAARPQDMQTSTIALERPIEKAFVDLPAGGPAVLGIVERTYYNATTQEITLENRARNSGENRMTVTIFGPVKKVTVPENRINNDPLATLNITPELGWFLPGVKMEVSNYYAQNRYGPFGYAVGRTRGGDGCIYAWQRIQASNVNGNWFSRQGAILVRLRYCAPRASEETLLELMTSFNINTYFLTPRWNPFGRAPPPPEDLGKFGVAMLPEPTAAMTTGTVDPAPRRPARVREVAPVAPPIETITPDMPIVPPPTLTPEASAVNATSGVVTANGIAGATVDPAIGVPLDGYPTVPPP